MVEFKEHPLGSESILTVSEHHWIKLTKIY